MDQDSTQAAPASPHDLELILQIGLRISAEHDINQLLQLTVKSIKQSLNHTYCAILLRDRDDLVIQAVTDYPEAIIGRRIPVGQGITGRCALSGTYSLVPDVRECPHYIDIGYDAFRSELDIPILFRGSVVGVLNTQDTRLDAFTDHDVHLLQVLASQIGVALHNAHIRNQLELVQTIGLQLVTITKVKDLFSSIVLQIRDRLRHYSCGILRVDGDHLVLEASTGGFSPQLTGLRIPFGHGITGRCALERRIINVGDLRLDTGYIPSGVTGARSEIAAPIMFESRLFGVLTIESALVNAFDDDDERLLSTLSAQLAVALQQAQLFATIEQQAITDGLTGLYNFRHFHQRLEVEMARATRYSRPLSLVMLDLDDFKRVNDRHGHLRGDGVLKEVARVMQSRIRRSDEPAAAKDTELDIASRYGGEEFMVIMPETSPAGAAVVAERLRAAIEAEVAANIWLTDDQGQAEAITASFGVAGFEKGDDTNRLMKRADDAVYAAKQAGKNRVIIMPGSCDVNATSA
jgi:diguanylate cyclase (GGDEF)-like protein